MHGELRADVPFQLVFARDNLFDRDLLFPAVAAVTLLAPRLRNLFRAAERAFRFRDRGFPGHRSPLYSAGTRDSGLGTRDSGRGTRDSGLGTRESGLGSREVGGRTRVEGAPTR